MSRGFWSQVLLGRSLPRKSEKSVKIGKNQPINRPSIRWGKIVCDHIGFPLGIGKYELEETTPVWKARMTTGLLLG